MEKFSSTVVKAFVGEHYRMWRGWKERIAEAPFTQRLGSGELSKQALGCSSETAHIYLW